MRFSFKIASVAGIPIELHVTFLLLLALVFYLGYIVEGELYLFYLVLFLFFFVTIHELSHSLVARHYKIKVRKIVLYPIGGVSEIEEIPENPGIEWRMAASGPLISIAIGLVLFVLKQYFSLELPPSIFPPTYSIYLSVTGSPMLDLAYLNIFLGLFNFIPAFPMDGGRVLRAYLAEHMSFADATARAASIGKVFGLFMVVFGVLYSFWFAIIGIFIYMGASEEAESVVVSNALASVRVNDVMTEKVISATPRTNLADAMEMMFKARYHDILVEDEHTYQGVVKWNIILKVKPEDRAKQVLGEMQMQKLYTFYDDSVLEAYKIMVRERIDLVPVVKKEDPKKVVGVITSEGIAFAYDKARGLR
jgi:Zn-dependent protease/CBS domain-containing protein